MLLPPPWSPLFPYTTLFRSRDLTRLADEVVSRRIENISGVGSVTLVGGLKRSEEHTSELQSHHDLVCRLLLEKKNVALATDCYSNLVIESVSCDSRMSLRAF